MILGLEHVHILKIQKTVHLNIPWHQVINTAVASIFKGNLECNVE